MAQRPGVQLRPRRAARDHVQKATISRAEGGQLVRRVGLLNRSSRAFVSGKRTALWHGLTIVCDTHAAVCAKQGAAQAVRRCLRARRRAFRMLDGACSSRKRAFRVGALRCVSGLAGRMCAPHGSRALLVAPLVRSRISCRRALVHRKRSACIRMLGRTSVSD